MVYGQQSKELLPVEIKSFLPEQFMVGQKTTIIDSLTLQQFKFQNLDDILAYYSPLAFKSYGYGQLSMASFRGTSPNHVALLWNGVNINQPTLGLTDFSTISLASFDQLKVQFGAASSTFGSDAVGGSIILNTLPHLKQTGWRATLAQQWASFNNYRTQGSVSFTGKGLKHWQLTSKTTAFNASINNRYPYQERNFYLVEPSNTFQQGLTHDMFLVNKKQQRIGLNIWLADNKQTIAPQDLLNREITQTQNYRFLSSYEAGRTSLKMGFIKDITNYGKGDFQQPDRTETDRYLIRFEQEFVKKFNDSDRQINLRLGGEWVHYANRTDGYGGQLIHENRKDIYALTRYHINQKLTLTLNIRQAFVEGYNPPFTPSLGGQYILKANRQMKLLLKGSLAQSYRVPTLNERYWLVLGNPSLRPEYGFSQEIGLAWQHTWQNHWTASADLTGYHNLIDNWVYWNPTHSYRVENLQQVRARGAEVSVKLNYTNRLWQMSIVGGYAYTRSSQEKSYDLNAFSTDVLGKQVVYIPLHNGNVNFYLQQKNTRLSFQNALSSRRYYTFDNSKWLDGYMLTNVVVAQHWAKKHYTFSLQAQANNVFDTLYLNIKRNAMPGRNYALSLFIEGF
jgi:vitamin B12 transporter